jgi:hypothetical protein
MDAFNSVLTAPSARSATERASKKIHTGNAGYSASK